MFVDRAKEILWVWLVRSFRLMPAQARRNICAMCWDAAARQDTSASLCELFRHQDMLQFRIEREALRHGGGIHPKHRLTGYHEFFCSRVRPGEKVLDVGCGYGAVAKSLCDAGAIVTAIDIDMENVRRARSRFGDSGILFLEADATRFLPADSFDVAVLSNVLEHIRDRQTFLQQILEQATPTRCLLRVPAETRDWTIPLRRELGLPHFSDPTHFIEYTEETFQREMADAGLEIREMLSRWGEIWAEVIPRATR